MKNFVSMIEFVDFLVAIISILVLENINQTNGREYGNLMISHTTVYRKQC